ncbi:acyltransferase family protein [Runella sp.]|uniref:acyltransferase family protein n=1 Tax=Runella sp. TaxID=1960881 RepID=UPI003D121552
MSDLKTDTRRYYLDWLRVIAFSLLVFYHTGLMFVDWGFHIQNDIFSNDLKLPMLFLNQWRLPLLFFISGAGIKFALKKRTAGAFLKERFVRIFIPLVFGILVVIPPQVYIERLYQNKFVGSYFQFYPHFFDGVYPQGNFTWNHLWFLVYLFVFTLITLPLFLLFRTEKGTNFVQRLHTFLAGRAALLFVFAVPLIIVEITLRAAWPTTRNLISDWYNFAFYILIFIYGYFTASTEKLWNAIEKDTWLYVFVGCVSFSMIYFGLHAKGKNFLESSALGYFGFQVFSSVNVVTWILGLIGLAKKYFNKNLPVLQYTNKAVYPFYILHQTVLLIAGYFILKTDYGIAVKYLLIVAATFIGSMVLYELVIRRVPWIGFFFGVKPEKSIS